MTKITVVRPDFAPVFSGVGFHNSEASTYRLMDKTAFDERICKLYREISPGFMRCFAGFSDWTKEAMDDFAEYYSRMQAVTDTPIYMTPGRGKYLFSAEEMDRYAADVAERLQYLVREKNVKHISYYCFSNEMGEVTGAALTKNLPRFKQLQEALYHAFQNAGLNIGLLATDASGDWTSVDWAMQNMDLITRDYCVHYYERQYALDDPNFYAWWEQKCAEYTNKVIRKQKHLILGEFGSTAVNCAFVGVSVRDTSTHYLSGDSETAYSAIKFTEMMIGAVNAGMYALALWTFMDYPDPYRAPAYSDEWGKMWTRYEPFLGFGGDVRYNKCGLLRWENVAETGESDPHKPRAHYAALGLVMRALKRNTKILSVSCDNPNIRACAVMNRDGSISVVAVNRSTTAEDVTFTVPTTAQKHPFRLYTFETRKPYVSPFADLPTYSATAERKDNTVTVQFPPESVCVLTDDYHEKTATVSAEILSCDTQKLTWKPVSDPRHCYYRVYKDGIQICSTVATSCAVDGDGKYTVKSVDRDGNE